MGSIRIKFHSFAGSGVYVFAGRVALFHVVVVVEEEEEEEEEEEGGGGGDCGGGKQNSVSLRLCDNTYAIFCNSENVSPCQTGKISNTSQCCDYFEL